MRKKISFFSFLVLGSSIGITATSAAQSLQTINLNHIIPDYNGKNSFKINSFFEQLTLNIKAKTLKTWEKLLHDPNQLKKTINKFLRDQAIISFFKKVDTENIKEDQWNLIDEISAYIFENFKQIIFFAHNKLYGISINFVITGLGEPYFIFNNMSPQEDSVSNSQNWVVEKFIPLAPNHLNIYISQNQWQNIILANKDKRKIKTILSTFPQSPSWNKSLISSEYLEIMAEFIIKCSDRINNYMIKNSLSGAIIYSDTKKSWNGIISQ